MLTLKLTLGEYDAILINDLRKDAIIHGDKLLNAALLKAKVGKYQIQAAISAVHAHSTQHSKTDWEQIHLLYQKLYEYNPTPVVEVNAAIALSYTYNAEIGLEALSQLENNKALKDYQPYYAAKADLLNRAGQTDRSITFYKKAIALSNNDAEASYLKNKLKKSEKH